MPAGHDRFSADLIEEHLGPLREQLGISHENLMGFGREHPTDYRRTVLHDGAGTQAGAPRECRFARCTAKFRAPCGRRSIPDRPEDAVPIGHITNGVHVPSWLAPQMCRLYDRHLGVGWQRQSGAAQTWEAIETVDDGELWETHLSLKAQLIEFVRRRAREQAERRSEPRRRCRRLDKVLSPDALTIGFARRFATYKRANLLLADMRAAGLDGQRRQAARCSLSLPARRIRTTSPASGCCSRSREMMRNSEFCRQVRLHRGLRHQRGPLSRAGRGRVAQQSAPSA